MRSARNCTANSRGDSLNELLYGLSVSCTFLVLEYCGAKPGHDSWFLIALLLGSHRRYEVMVRSCRIHESTTEATDLVFFGEYSTTTKQKQAPLWKQASLSCTLLATRPDDM